MNTQKGQNVSNVPMEARCVLCGSPVSFIRSYRIPVEDVTNYTKQIDPASAVTDDWEVVCDENDHRLDSGSVDMDGRSALMGYRGALSMAGLR